MWKKDVHLYLLGILNLRCQKLISYHVEQEFNEILKQSHRKTVGVLVCLFAGFLRLPMRRSGRALEAPNT